MEILHRDIMDQLEKYEDRREIIVIKGPRQAGKTTIMKNIEQNMEGNKGFINFENAATRKEFEESPIAFVKSFGANGKLTIFMDEVQKLDKGGEKLKLLFDEIDGLKIYASGSSSLELRSNVLHALAGRALIFELLTFSFGEFLGSRDKGLYEVYSELHASVARFIKDGGKPAPPALSLGLAGYLKDYLVYGGYPEVVKESKDTEIREKLITDIFNLYMDKDAVSFFDIREANKFMAFSKAIAFSTANILNLSSLANDISITGYMADKFLGAMVNSYMVSAVQPFYKNVRTEIKKAPKIYFYDLGMRNSILGNFTAFDNREDRGTLAKNFVFRELLTMGYKPKYWRTTGNAEMDFVIEMPDGVLPVEVKLGGSEALGRSFYSFVEAYKPKRALVVTLNEYFEKKVGDTTVCGVPIFYL